MCGLDSLQPDQLPRGGILTKGTGLAQKGKRQKHRGGRFKVKCISYSGHKDPGEGEGRWRSQHSRCSVDRGLSLKPLSSLWWEESPETQGNRESTEKFCIQTGAMGTREGQPTDSLGLRGRKLEELQSSK